MKHRSDGQRRSRRITLCALVTVLVPLLVACAGVLPPSAALPVADTTSVPQTTTVRMDAAATSAALGTSSNAATAPTAETMTAASGGTAPLSAVAAADLAPSDQQVLRIAWNEPATLDPAAIISANDQAIFQQLFTGLTRLDPDLTPQPGIAASWTFNADNTQVTFTLRETQWSDGKPLTAQDFAYAWRRAVDPQSAPPGAGSLTGGIIKGETALRSTPVTDTARLQQARDGFGVTALDATTLQVTLERPAPFFPSITAVNAHLAPVRQDVIEHHGVTWTDPGHLIGNGPFVLKGWTKGTDLTLAPNPHYYAGPPRLTALTFTFIVDFAVAFTNYQAGAVDSCSPPTSQIAALRADPQFKDQIVDIPQLGTFMLGWNTTKPPFNNATVRQAFAAAIDRQSIVQQVLQGVGTPAYSLIPPGMPGHVTPAEAGTTQRYDPTHAKQLLAEAGYSNGHGFPALKLRYLNSPPYSLIIQRVQADLQTTLGVSITLDPGPPNPGPYFSGIITNPPDFFFMGYRASFPDPYDADVGNFGPGGDPGKWQDGAFTHLIAQADRQTDPAQRIAMYKQAEQILAQDAARAFVLWFGTFRLIKPYVKGLTYTARDFLPGQSTLQDAYILKH
ncbi:MAG: ABC transporter substrate-binding protein [Herpetosiphon sp.]